MVDLYLTRASRFVEADPARSRDSSDIEYRGPYVVFADSYSEASKKTLKHVNSGRSRVWNVTSSPKKLTALVDVLTPITRAAILREAGIEVIE